MSEIQQQRPEPVAFNSEVARRAEAPRSRAEKIASAVAYHAGPEIGFTAAFGGGGAILVHPTVLPIVAALTTLWAVVDRLARRGEGTAQTRSTRTDRAQADKAADAAEGVA